MTQQDALNTLKESPTRWFTTREVAGIIGCSCSSAARSLRKLYPVHAVRELIAIKTGGYRYRYKLR